MNEGGSSEVLFSYIPLLFLLAINKPIFTKKDHFNNQRGLQRKRHKQLLLIGEIWDYLMYQSDIICQMLYHHMLNVINI